MPHPARPTESQAIRVAAQTRRLRVWPVLRWLPFAGVGLASLVESALAPLGRKPFQFDWSLSVEALHFSITKGPHIGATMLLAFLAVVATGRQRPLLAFALTLLIGAGWELGQTTVVGHSARLADLAPDAVGALLGCAWGALACWLTEFQTAERRVGPSAGV